MARKYFSPHHLLAVVLEAIGYEEERNKFRQEHRHKFRCVLKEFIMQSNVIQKHVSEKKM